MTSSDISSNGSGYASLYPQAVLFPILAFPAWLLCLPPLFWHFRQGNIAAGSLITWFVLNNLSNSINPLIWPRDNLSEWWDGKGWCDINARLQVGSSVAHAACTVMIVRKLAKVMDTRNIVVSAGRNSKLKEKIWTLIWCWAYPMLLIALYYVVQRTRYYILGIIGCRAAYDTSWPTVVLIFMWGPITMIVAAYYAGLLIYRLYRYRCEFQRLVSARNTTKSRFIRLFVISMIIICIYLPYTLYINVLVLGWEWGTYDWNSVHSPQFTSIVKVPAYGKVSFERWMYVCTGYVIFFVFGTGTDAHSLYKKMLLGIGLGKVFPSLYRTSNGGSNTQHSFIKSWGSSLSTKAKSMFFSKSLDTMTSTVDDSTRNNSVVLDSIPRLKHVTSEERVLVSRQQQTLPNTKRTIFARFFSRKQNNNNGDFVLPLFSRNTDGEVTSADKSAARSSLSGVHAHVWASETSAVGRLSEADGVQIVKEFSQNSSSKEDGDLEKETAAVWT